MSLFKDFNKDAKDLLSKNYSDAGKWKVESKFKGPKDVLYVNPQATNGGVSVDFEYASSAFPVKAKVNVTPALDAKVTATYDADGHKLEVVADKALEYEVSYEGKLGKVSLNDKLTKKGVDAGVAYAVASKCQVGAGVTYGFNGSLAWTAGARYSDAGRLVAIVTSQLKSYSTSLLLPLSCCDRKTTVAAQVDCGSGKFAATVGAETACVLFPQNTLRVRVNNNLEWAVAYITKFSDNWKAAVTVDASLKPGVLITRE